MIFDGDLRRLADYVRDMADRIGLTEHAISVGCGPMEVEGHGAECELITGQKRATITFREDWPHWSAKQLCQTVAHELIHCHVNPVMFSTMMLVEDQVSSAIYGVIWKVAEERLEFAVDGIAMAWAETLPLPEGKRKKGKK